ncbi:Kelch domain containing [Seminavis robusta]|uniref:Kelch domain containing n=1 Tax=Seminavis robusta TaxID=568900 RepID=A0A9N8ERK2_9STRA|nr:Kelch domain containing [Seminavis robusta]|eukprot:Sro1634_g287500.1 Kelch domain containing (448) ;mRNA; r:20636-21979
MEEVTMNDCTCPFEPWGRYSASGGVFSRGVNGTDIAMYSFGGDTGSHADGLGGVVLTHWKYPLNNNNNGCNCWERLADSPVEVGYRGTATQIGDFVYIIGGSDRRRQAIDQIWQYSLSLDTWTLVDSQLPTPRWRHAAVAIDETRILITGGRQGRLVLSDVWIFDTANLTWTQLEDVMLPPMYRHEMSFDKDRNFVWIYGGLDQTLARYPSTLWQLRLNSQSVVEIVADTTVNPLPPRLASHMMEYISHLDVVILWGGGCSDDAELHVYDIQENTWCGIYPANRPDRRDAMLWSLHYPYIYMAQGDIICYNRQVLPISDVHVLDLTTHNAWEMLYEPFNSRGTGREPYCNGSNNGNCQPNPLFGDTENRGSTCSDELLARFADPSLLAEYEEEDLLLSKAEEYPSPKSLVNAEEPMMITSGSSFRHGPGMLPVVLSILLLVLTRRRG